MQMAELQEMFEGMLRPIMERLGELEKLASEARDDDRKLEGETEAAELEVEVPDEVAEEVAEKIEEVVEEAQEDEEEEGESEMMYKYSKMSEKIAELEKASVLAEATIADLREQIAQRDAQDAVSADIANKPHLSQMSEKLVGIYRKDRDLYAEVLNVAGEAKADTKSILSQRVTSGFSEVQAPKDPFAAAHEVAASEGISYRAALEGLLAK
jgi:chromosome segregation ATPase